MMEVTTKGELAVQVHGAFEPFCGPIELAGYLADLGVTGRRKESGCCPLANLLTAMMDGRPVLVGNMDVATYDDDGRTIEVALPWVAQSFIDLFDRGQYPYLIERDPDDDEPSDEDV